MIEERYLATGQQKRYKFILVGDSNVGKTALFWRFTEGDFLAEKQTQVTTIDFKIKNIQLNNESVKLYIWDTAGQQKYRSIVSTYFKGCHGVILVFDLTRESSFDNAIKQWYELIKIKAQTANILLIGNKTDLADSNKVSESRIKEWSEKNKIKYLLTSVKNGTNVKEAFMILAEIVDADKMKTIKSQNIQLKKNMEKKKDKCC